MTTSRTKVERLLTNLCSADLRESKHFFTSLFNFTVGFEADWFIQLVADDSGFEVGLLEPNSRLMPVQFQSLPRGAYITIVVEDVMTVYKRVRELGYDVVSEPEVTFYGQHRLLLKDPGGILVDVSSPAKAH